jgi:hypothetical protein
MSQRKVPEQADSEKPTSQEALHTSSNEPQAPEALVPEQANSEVPSNQETMTIPDTIISICHMRVVCFHQDMGVIFTLEFIDDTEDFVNSSIMFTQILDSIRFLS